MFWERFYKLCMSNNTKPLTVVKNLSLAAGSITKWKNGTVPNGETLRKIADHFSVSTDYLLGRSESKLPSEYDTYFEIQDILADIDENAANTYTIHGSQGKGSVVKSIPKDKYILIGEGETIKLSKAEFTVVKGVIEAMRPKDKN